MKLILKILTQMIKTFLEKAITVIVIGFLFWITISVIDVNLSNSPANQGKLSDTNFFKIFEVNENEN